MFSNYIVSLTYEHPPSQGFLLECVIIITTLKGGFLRYLEGLLLKLEDNKELCPKVHRNKMDENS